VSTIKVWGQDSAPKPKAALQAEIDTLKEEKAQLEAELRKLRDDRR
jgi:cell division protein FtsB